jgi:exopolysaccharide biosynthesis protein
VTIRILSRISLMIAIIALISAWCEPLFAQGEKDVEVFQGNLAVGGEKHAVNMVRVKLDRIRVKVALAHDHVGRTENLADMASRNKAIAAINGSFFDAYISNPIKNPEHTLITGGKIVHVGGVGTLCWFSASQQAMMERIKFTIEGSINGSYHYPQRWFAYWINRYPTADTITIFTPHWGSSTGLSDGVQVVVSGGVVRSIGKGPQAIPKDGFVIYFRNLYKDLHQKFSIGDRVDYRIMMKKGDSPHFWSSVQEGLEAGPLLVRKGRPCPDPASEGFSSAKILTMSCARSALGITGDGYLLLVTTDGTIGQLAEMMKLMGAEEAMNLDGGASSSLWCRGKYITAPGRDISNALVILPGTPASSPAMPASSPPLPGSSPAAPGSLTPVPIDSVTPATPTPEASPSLPMASSPGSSPLLSPQVTAFTPEPPREQPNSPNIWLFITGGLLIFAIITLVLLKRKGGGRREKDKSGGPDDGPPGDWNF